MMPMAVHDYVYTNIKTEPTYQEVVEKTRILGSNKVAMNMRPVPMDIGEMWDGYTLGIGWVWTRYIMNIG